MNTDDPTRSFTYAALPARILFGAGRVADLPAESTRLGLQRLLVLATPGQRPLAEMAAALLGRQAAGMFAAARMHVPIATADQARAEARRVGADGCVAIGGGSAIGLGKAIALDMGLPIIAIPTTYAGSEMTPVWGITYRDGKHTGRADAVLPRSVIYDPDLTRDLPATLSGLSGVNAIAHAVEALYAPDTSPVICLYAGQAIRDLTAALPTIAASPHDAAARASALRGAWLCGSCLGATTMSLHHKLCHVLGGTFDLPHAQTHAVLLPYVAAFNLPYSAHAAAVLSDAMDTADPPAALYELARNVGAPQSLRELGLTEADLPTVVADVLSRPYSNPRAVTAESLTLLLTEALEGRVIAPGGAFPTASPRSARGRPGRTGQGC